MTKHYLRKGILFIFVLLIQISCIQLFSQVTISGGSTVNGSYPSIANAVIALNGATISGPVIVDVAAGHSETAPVGGIILTATGTSANPITIQKSGAGANPLINAYVGVSTPTTDNKRWKLTPRGNSYDEFNLCNKISIDSYGCNRIKLK